MALSYGFNPPYHPNYRHDHRYFEAESRKHTEKIRKGGVKEAINPEPTSDSNAQQDCSDEDRTNIS